MRVRLELANGTHIVEGPGPITGKLRAASVPGGIIIESTENDIHDGGQVIPIVSMTPDTPSLSQGIPAGDPRPFIAPGERWVFLDPGEITKLMPPDDAACTALWNVMKQRLHLDLYDMYPRLAHVLSLFGDAGAPASAQGAQRDLGWLMRYWHLRNGGPVARGEFQTIATHGSDGWSNYHYHELLWVGLNFLRNRRPSDWWLGLRMAFAQASWGMVYHGRFAGMFKGEKSYENYFGAAFQPEWAKQYFLGLVFWWFLSDRHPVIDAAVQAHLACLRRTPPNWWQGAWGERQAARYLESLETAFIITGDVAFKTIADQAIASIWTWRDVTTGLWLNRGNNPAGVLEQTSPWGHGKLINQLLRWEVRGVKHGDAVAAADVVMQKGTFIRNGNPYCYYQFAGPEKTHLSGGQLNAFMLRMIAATQSAAVSKLWHDFTYGPYLGASVAEADAHAPVPLADLGIDLASQGLSGWPKSCKELQCGIM